MSTTRNIRTWADFETARKAGEVTPAEQELVAACKEGRECVLGDGARPNEAGIEHDIGADLLRYLITGGCKDCDLHDWGVQLKGAYVSAPLDLSFATTVGITKLRACTFAEPIQALQCSFEFLNLSGSYCTGLNAQGARVRGGVFLSNGFTVKGRVSVSSATIEGALNCSKGTFHNSDGKAFNAQKCRAGSLIWRGVVSVKGSVSFDGATIEDLADDMESWGLPDKLRLNGFTYTTIHGPTDESLRLGWLAKSQEGRRAFQPQPYEQLAYVLKRMGHTREARHVQYAKECKLAVSQRDEIWLERKVSTAKGWRGVLARQAQDGWHWLRDIASAVKHAALSLIVGYGYLPARSLVLAVVMIASAALFYSYVWVNGGMVPNTPVVLNSPSWAAAMEERPSAPARLWAKGEIGQHYETFFSPTYAADVFIPLIDFGQETAWAPTTATKLGTFAWAMAWLLKGFGWIVTALGAAAITGIIRRD
ncbi:hypothetical protein KO498_05915 [Lentibacter algarum]|uniref:hypothetical protein n=1 Tax=Lentibacter algarum TaxID=576131 RepID=UPI001C07C46F|nr:hypothetical protein [Lentibacter algarum]MBU2981346.1 hypothetical protein [Lentibacter algarum]